MNSVLFSGRLTKDPEFRLVGEKKTPKCKIGMAINDGYGEKRKTFFIDVEVWNKTAENVNTFLKKGHPALVKGRLREDKWTDKEGNEISRLVVSADEVEFLQKKQDDTTSSVGPEVDGFELTDELAPF